MHSRGATAVGHTKGDEMEAKQHGFSFTYLLHPPPSIHPSIQPPAKHSAPCVGATMLTEAWLMGKISKAFACKSLYAMEEMDINPPITQL